MPLENSCDVRDNQRTCYLSAVDYALLASPLLPWAHLQNENCGCSFLPVVRLLTSICVSIWPVLKRRMRMYTSFVSSPCFTGKLGNPSFCVICAQLRSLPPTFRAFCVFLRLLPSITDTRLYGARFLDCALCIQVPMRAVCDSGDAVE